MQEILYFIVLNSKKQKPLYQLHETPFVFRRFVELIKQDFFFNLLNFDDFNRKLGFMSVLSLTFRNKLSGKLNLRVEIL